MEILERSKQWKIGHTFEKERMGVKGKGKTIPVTGRGDP
jgi:hypothetical protein